MNRHTVGAVLGALACIALATPARAVHYNRGGFVPAMQSCSPESADTQTSGGIPACSGARRVSDCAADPANALDLGPKTKTAYTYRNTGRRETHSNSDDVDIFATLVATDIRRCDGTPYSGTLDLAVTARMYREDEICATGKCVVPDFTFAHEVACNEGTCRLRRDTANRALVALGLPLLPSDKVFSLRYVRFAILDLAGRPLLTNGLEISPARRTASAPSGALPSWMDGLVAWLSPPTAEACRETPVSRRRGSGVHERAPRYVETRPNVAHRLLTRYINAYEACTLEQADTFTSEGVPACTARPISDCTSDPVNAVTAVIPVKEQTREGRGKFHYKVVGDRLDIEGHLEGVQDCAGRPYAGPLKLKMNVRATLDDPACGDSPCTTVDTVLFEKDLELIDGAVWVNVKEPIPSMGPFTGDAKRIAFELLDTVITDRSGNVAFEGPASLVRCNPIRRRTAGFCYGN